MSRVVVISNRVMLPNEKKPEAAGGLAVALFDTLQETNGLWFGWSGRITTNEDVKPNVKKDEGITYAIVDLTKKITKITIMVIVTKYCGLFFTIDWT